MSAERKKPAIPPTKADRSLFRRAMTDVRPLGEGEGDDAAAQSDPVPDFKPSLEIRPPKVPPPTSGPRPPPSEKKLPHLEIGAASGIDGRTLTRLKRGQISPEARLDLHGMTLDDAQAAVSGFIERCAGRGLRCVIVITGKGRVGQESGTIRSDLPRWLNQGSTRARVLAFAEAQPRDGGAGARYVLLRRKVRAKP